MTRRHSRHVISRARFFLSLAVQCKGNQRDEFEAYLEATIVFARAALHRLQSEYKKHPDWKIWWNSLLSNPAITFFCVERDWILKEGPPKIGQVIRLGKSTKPAASHYYFENPDILATVTIERHLNEMEQLILNAESNFRSIT